MQKIDFFNYFFENFFDLSAFGGTGSFVLVSNSAFKTLFLNIINILNLKKFIWKTTYESYKSEERYSAT